MRGELQCTLRRRNGQDGLDVPLHHRAQGAMCGKTARRGGGMELQRRGVYARLTGQIRRELGLAFCRSDRHIHDATRKRERERERKKREREKKKEREQESESVRA